MKWMDKEKWYTQMEILMMVNGEKVIKMDMELLNSKMEITMKVILRMINLMDLVNMVIII